MTSGRGAAHSRRYEEKMREAGFRLKHLWVPDDRADELESIAKAMRNGNGTIAVAALAPETTTSRALSDRARKILALVESTLDGAGVEVIERLERQAKIAADIKAAQRRNRDR